MQLCTAEPQIKKARAGKIQHRPVLAFHFAVALVATCLRGLALDCNGNGAEDSLDIELGTSEDCAGDGIPDECQREFAGRKIFSSSISVTDFLSADLDADGQLDLILCSDQAEEVDVRRGQGTRGFLPPVRFPSPIVARDLGLADLNGDGLLDLVVYSGGISPSLAALPGNSAGGFDPAPEIPLPARPVRGPTALDLDGDGAIDLAFGAFMREVQVMRGRGDTTFAPALRFAMQSGILAFAGGDFDRDQREELVVALGGASELSFYTLSVTGTLDPAPDHPIVGEGPIGMAAADLDQDGNLDLAVANQVSRDVTVLLGRGDVTFSRRNGPVLGGRPMALVAADANADGKLDLLSADLESDDYSFLGGAGDGSFASAVVSSGVGEPRSFAVLDLTGDMRPDLGVLDTSVHGISILAGDGEGRFASGRRKALSGASLTLLQPADLDGDGDEDILGCSEFDQFVYVIQAVGGALGGVEAWPVGLRAGDLAVADVDADGELDVVTANFDSGDLSLLRGLGGRTFAEELRLPATGRPSSVVAEDLDGDGLIDVASLGVTGGGVVLRAVTPGAFDDPVSVNLGGNLALLTVDMNQDGLLDLASTQITANQVVVALASAPLVFASPERFAVQMFPVDLVRADLDLNGTPDLVSANQASNNLTILPGRGDGSFLEGREMLVGYSPIDVLAVDLNADGRVDLASANYNSHDLSYLVGNGDGTFHAQEALPVPWCRAVTAVDLDLDGRPDLVGAGLETSELLIFMNDGFARDLPPLLSVPATVGFPCAEGGSVPVQWEVSALDDCDPSPSVTCDRESGSNFEPGVTVVSCTATDSAGQSATRSFEVVVGDREAPVITCPGNLVGVCGPDGAEPVHFSVEASDSCDPEPQIECNHASGEVFQFGITHVLCRATDSAGNSSTCTFTVSMKACPSNNQLPGDCNQDALLDVSDGVCLLGFLFLGSPAELPCGPGGGSPTATMDLLDWNGDARLDLSDAAASLGWLFLGNRPHVRGATCTLIPGCPPMCGGR